ncbi:MAG: amino acid permease [Cetobacterium sp.]|uniref:amino acid permease n=1 Tax=Cetobacterium sp. TaxID=2071632 RepID=UPI002FC966A8
MNKKKINLIGLIMIIFIGVFGFGNIANNYKVIGTQSSTIFIVGAILYFLPMALIMAEFGSYAKDRTGGIYAWIEIGMGKNFAYFAIWSYFISNIFYLPTLATRVPTYLSFFLYGDSSISNYWMAFLAAITLLVALFIGIVYESKLEKLSTPVGYISLAVAAIFLIGGAYLFFTGRAETAITLDSFVVKINDQNQFASVLSTFAWVLFAYGGCEICGTYVDKIEHPERNFVKSVLGAAIIIGLLYVFGILSIAAYGTPDEFSKVSLVNAVISGYKFMGDKFGFGLWFVRMIGFTYTLITLVALVLWSVALSRAVFSEVPPKTFPNWLTKKNEKGILKNALIFQTVLSFLFIVITTFGGKSAGDLYYKIYDMSTMAFLLPYLSLGIAYINFRKSGKIATFQATKSMFGAYVLGSLVATLAIVSLIFAGINISQPLSSQIDTIILYYGGLLLFLFIGFIIKIIDFKE